MIKKNADQSKGKQKNIQSSGSKYLYKAGIALLLIITYIVYSAGMKGDVLQFDDIEYFTRYPEILKLSWQNIYKIFTSHYLIMYQPLPVLSFALNYHFTHLETAPIHTVNLIFHLFNIVLVYVFCKNLLSSRNIALIAAALFALHPLNAEVVYWISARSSGMYVFFYLLALIQYQKYITSGYRMQYFLYAFLLFIPALLSKSQAVTLPPVLILIDYFSGRKWLSKRILAEKIPFLAMSLVFGLITLADKGTMTNLTKGMMIGYNGLDKLCMACYSFCFYLYKLLLPVNLCSIYVYPPKDGGFLSWEFYLAAMVIIFLAVIVYRFRNNRLAVFCVLLFVITISINIQLIPSRNFITADRYAYFPFIGLFILITKQLMVIFEKFQYKKYRGILILCFVLFLFFCIIQIKGREPVWKNDYNMMSDIIEKNAEVPYISRAYGNRAIYYSTLGEHQLAIRDFTEALRIKPDDAQSYYNRGFEYLKLNQYNPAIKDFDSAIYYEPGQGVIFAKRAMAFYKSANNAGAKADCDKAIRLDSTLYDACNLRAALFYNTKQYDSCLADLNHTIRINPGFSDAYMNRGLLYMQLGREDDACGDFRKAAGMGNERAKESLRINCPDIPF